jgi:hypothetical protein
MKKEKPFFLLKEILPLPTELVYVISKYVGKYIKWRDPVELIYKTKERRLKYHTKHFVNVVK